MYIDLNYKKTDSGEPGTNQAPGIEAKGEQVISDTTSTVPTSPATETPAAPSAEIDSTPIVTTIDTVESAPVSTVPAAPDSGKVLDGYLENGYYKGEGKARYVDPGLLGETAQAIAQALAAGGMKPNGYNPILRPLKKVKKKASPLDAKTGALQGAIPKAKLLEQRKRAPHLLVEVLEKNRDAVKDGADYEAAYQHLEAIGAFLGDYSE